MSRTDVSAASTEPVATPSASSPEFSMNGGPGATIEHGAQSFWAIHTVGRACEAELAPDVGVVEREVATGGGLGRHQLGRRRGQGAAATGRR